MRRGKSRGDRKARSRAVRLFRDGEANVGEATGRGSAQGQAAHRRRYRSGRTPLNGYHALIAFVMTLLPLYPAHLLTR